MKPTGKILFVDDDPVVLENTKQFFSEVCDLTVASSAEEGLQCLEKAGPFAVVVSDKDMPGMDGIEFLEQVREISPETIRIIITGIADPQIPVDAINRDGVFRFLRKPCTPDVLGAAFAAGLKQHALKQLEKDILESTLTGSIKMMTDVLGMVAPDALGRGQRLRESMAKFVTWLNAAPRWELEMGALLSPIGYAVVPSGILRKLSIGADLLPEEVNIVRRAPRNGHELIADIPRLEGIAKIVLYQRKNYDSTGFPDDSVGGEHIPLGARILRILNDRLDLENDGVVKTAALEAMRSRPGRYDPHLLIECFRCFDAFLANALIADRPVTSPGIHDLQPGDVVVSAICARNGFVLVGSGTRLTAMMIERLHNFGEIGEVREPIFIQRQGAPEPALAAP